MPGLRERKKQRTRETLQREALRLIAAQGYSRTSVEQIAEAAEVSVSTFFRYFPAKEDVVLQDEYDPMATQHILDQPAELSPLAAVRRGMAAAVAEIHPAEREAILQRTRLMMTEPDLRARGYQEHQALIGTMAEVLGARAGRPAGDPAVRRVAGALAGALTVAVQDWAEGGGAEDLATVVDTALAHLESGLAL
ncbi:MAG: TetR family transcriptional regulator [Mycobacteriales bacterium]